MRNNRDDDAIREGSRQTAQLRAEERAARLKRARALLDEGFSRAEVARLVRLSRDTVTLVWRGQL